jgi:hypothetical protein
MCHLNQNTLPKKIKYSLWIFGILFVMGLVIFFLDVKRFEPTFSLFHQFVWGEHFYAFFVGTLFFFLLFYWVILKFSNQEYWDCFIVILIIFLVFVGPLLAYQSLKDELNDKFRPPEAKIDSRCQFIVDLFSWLLALILIFTFYQNELKLLWNNS